MPSRPDDVRQSLGLPDFVDPVDVGEASLAASQTWGDERPATARGLSTGDPAAGVARPFGSAGHASRFAGDDSGDGDNASARLDLVALVHHPLCLETGLSPSDAAALERSERAALAAMRAVVVTSPRTADTLVSLMSVPAGAITVALPGVDDAPIAPGSRDGVLRLLCVGTVVPRKGQALLVDALSGVPGRWELTIVGSLETDPATADRLRAVIGETRLGERVHLVGELSSEALSVHYDASDLLVSASFYEGYGMALAEALARGLPIVAAAGGAVADTVPSAAGLLVPPGDRDALREALTRCVREPALLARLREGALLARERLPRWPDTAACVEYALLGKAT